MPIRSPNLTLSIRQKWTRRRRRRRSKTQKKTKRKKMSFSMRMTMLHSYLPHNPRRHIHRCRWYRHSQEQQPRQFACLSVAARENSSIFLVSIAARSRITSNPNIAKISSWKAVSHQNSIPSSLGSPYFSEVQFASRPRPSPSSS